MRIDKNVFMRYTDKKGLGGFMESIVFSRAAYRSAEAYLKYCKENGKSKEIISVATMTEREGHIFYLKISKKLVNLDSIYFRFTSKHIAVDESETLKNSPLRIIEYDESDPGIMVSVNDEFYDTFKLLSPEQIELISDLSFLIEATRNWYQKYHNDIKSPEPRVSVNAPSFIAPNASSEQKNAIKTVLTSPISYVWGPPGTGKTQVVLASCIASITKSNSKVLLVCPTNNALEQSLHGIIKMYREADININSILRMGNASRSFSLLYPDLCEKGSINKEVAKLETEINRLKTTLHELKISKKLTIHKELLLSLYTKLSEISITLTQTDNNILFKSKDITLIQNDLKAKEEKITGLKRILANYTEFISVKNVNSLFSELYSSYAKLKNSLTELKLQEKELNASYDIYQTSYNNHENENRKHQLEINSIRITLNSVSFKLKKLFIRDDSAILLSKINSFESAIASNNKEISSLKVQLELTEEKLQSIRSQINNLNTSLSEQTKKIQHLAESNNLSFSSVEKFKSHIEEIINSLTSVNPDTLSIDSIKAEISVLDEDIKNQKAIFNSVSQELSKLEEIKIAAISQKTLTSEQIKGIILPHFPEEIKLDEDVGEKYISRIFSYSLSEESYASLEAALLEKSANYNSLKAILSQTYISKNVFACTLDYLILHFSELAAILNNNLSQIFVDEAAYCSLVKAAPIFTLGVPVAFFGDHMQLPPINEMETDNSRDNPTDLSFLWSQSALYFPSVFSKECDIESLKDTYYNEKAPIFSNLSTATLNHTYRFGNNLASILNKFVYKSNFHGNDTDTLIKIIDAPRLPSEQHLRENHSEVDAIRNFIDTNRPGDFAILTPYKKQRELIKKALNYRTEVYTIHASQGREWDTIILSVVDTRKMFFTDTNNIDQKALKVINTAISRAKKELVIVCDKKYWISKSSDQLIGNIVSEFSKNS